MTRWRLADRTLELPPPLRGGDRQRDPRLVLRGRSLRRRPRRPSSTAWRWSRPASTCSTSAPFRRRSGAPVSAERGGRPADPGDRGPGARRADVPLSADTFEPEVARRALDAGAAAINDTSGGRRGDARAGRRARMRLRPHAHRGPAEVRSRARRPRRPGRSPERWFTDRIEAARGLGVAEEQIALDPGLDFDLSVEDDLEILARLDELRDLGRPLFVALSRKDFLGAVLAGSWSRASAGGRSRMGDRRGDRARGRQRRRHRPAARLEPRSTPCGWRPRSRAAAPAPGTRPRRPVASVAGRRRRGRAGIARSSPAASTAGWWPRALEPARTAEHGRDPLLAGARAGGGPASRRDRDPVLPSARGARGRRGRATSW